MVIQCPATFAVYFSYNRTYLIYAFFMFVGSQCPDEINSLNESNFLRVFVYKEKCLMFLKKEKTSWAQASSKCQNFGLGIAGNLVTIPDMATMNFIIDILKHTLRWTHESLWIGLTVHRSRWKWAAGIITIDL